MIPKTIHYCWFSGEEKSEEVKNCIQSWKNILTDYKLIEWDLDSFGKDIIPFVSQAISEKKWAFAADYFRLWVLYNYGGIYLDCDVVINQMIDKFLNNEVFLGWQDIDFLETHLIGSVPGHSFIRECMSFYEKKEFINPDGSLFLVPMPAIITKLATDKFGLKRNYKPQILKKNVMVYTADNFSINCENHNNYAKHLFLGSWSEKTEKNYYDEIVHRHFEFTNSGIPVLYLLKRRIREKLSELKHKII